MALDPEKFQKRPDRIPLSTGFTYTPREELEGFELQPDIVGAMNRRMDEHNRLHQKPQPEVVPPRPRPTAKDWQPFLAHLRKELGLDDTTEEIIGDKHE